MVLSQTATRHNVTKTARSILAAADKAEPGIRRAMLEALDGLQRSVPNLEKLIASGDVKAVVDAVKGAGIPESLMNALTDATASAAIGGAEAAGFEMAFNQVNQRAIRWAEQNVADLITGRVDKALVRRIVTRGTTEGIHPRLTAKLLRDVIPIFPRHQAVVDRVYEGAIKAGVTPQQAGKTAAKKSARYVKYRSEMVARTEAMRAANMGQQLAWETAIDLDLLPKGVKKVWVATPDACPICEPLDGTSVPVVGKGNNWALGSSASWGPQVTPPAHPNCRCSLILEPL